MIDSTTFTVSIPKDKVDRVISLIADALASDLMTIHEAQQLADSHSAPPVEQGVQTPYSNARPRGRSAFNGVRFFDDSNRRIIHLFTDAAQRMGAFYFDDVNSPACDWRDHACHLPPEHALALPSPNRDPHEHFDINIFEITALLRAFEVWSQQWRGKLIVIRTDSSTTQLGLIKQTLNAESQNDPLYTATPPNILAAQLDIKIEPQQLPGEENGRADALSRDLQDHIASRCPYW
ncbi:hypothetical protein Egran_06099 [Elaphomyces granulatus]|uniref:Uncharacterized protein n=1 Tax=Elaphomyces granulatus TaxID=519963 RepID=A0A232LPP5_9EURO|nr:hypothetical protein Egran_06099 [Elaphomyces granulatus]